MPPCPAGTRGRHAATRRFLRARGAGRSTSRDSTYAESRRGSIEVPALVVLGSEVEDLRADRVEDLTAGVDLIEDHLAERGEVLRVDDRFGVPEPGERTTEELFALDVEHDAELRRLALHRARREQVLVRSDARTCVDAKRVRTPRPKEQQR